MELPFGAVGRVCPRNSVLDGGSEKKLPLEVVIFCGGMGRCNVMDRENMAL